MLEGGDEGVVTSLGFFVTFGGGLGLFFEALGLVNGVNEFGVGFNDFPAIDDDLELVDEFFVFIIRAGEWLEVAGEGVENDGSD